MEKFRTAKQVGDLIGLSVKALRLYEERGLISPGRSTAGWRVYGDADIRQLHQICALKSVGLLLGEIAELLTKSVDLADLLDIQSEIIETRYENALKARRIVRQARQKIDSGIQLSTDDFINLIKETNMSDVEIPEAFKKLNAKHYSEEQIEDIVSHKMSPEFQKEIEALWNGIFADIRKLKNGPADTPAALDVARRWREASALFHKGDKTIEASTSQWYEDGFSNPETAKEMPFSEDIWVFAKAALTVLAAREASDA